MVAEDFSNEELWWKVLHNAIEVHDEVVEEYLNTELVKRFDAGVRSVSKHKPPSRLDSISHLIGKDGFVAKR